MIEVTRRQLLSWSTRLAALIGLEATAIPRVAEALQNINAGNAPLLWLQGMSCSGCSVSLLNSESPTPARILTQYLSLTFHSTLSAATGDVAVDIINKTISRGGYLLAVEGSMPAGMPRACMLGDEPVTEQVLRAARNARAVVCIGACASFGGIPAAEKNPTGAVDVATFLKNANVGTPVIRIPGCPAHPDWTVGTIVHLLKFGMPPLDDLARPQMFFKKIMHDQCPRFADYERERFAKSFSESGCLFKLGCLGPITHADCSMRQWNGRINFCIKAGAPCISCAGNRFALSQSTPFYTMHAPELREKE